MDANTWTVTDLIYDVRAFGGLDADLTVTGVRRYSVVKVVLSQAVCQRIELIDCYNLGVTGVVTKDGSI